MADACVFLMENRDFKDVINSMTPKTTDNKSCEAVLSTQHLALNTEVRNTHINIGKGVDIYIKELAETIKEIIVF